MNSTKHNIKGNSFVIIFFILLLMILFVVGNQLRPISTEQYLHITVKQGDTLWSIAKAYNDDTYRKPEAFISWVEKVNQIQPEAIVPGQIIIIPIKS